MARAARTSKKEPLPVEPLTIEEINERYEGQRVIVEVTEWGPYRQPLSGRLIAVGTDKAVTKVLMDLPRPSDPDRPYFFFWAMRTVKTMEEWSAILERAAREEPAFGRR